MGKSLFQCGIGIVYRENAVGRLYSLTFIDHNTGVVLNGSRLGKEYAANGIINSLENPHKHEHITNMRQPQSSTQFTSQQQSLPPQREQPIHRTEHHPYSVGESIGSLFDIPILPNNTDPEEDEFRRRMQRKKKKGR